MTSTDSTSLSSGQVNPQHPTMPNTQPHHRHPDFWLSRARVELIMQPRRRETRVQESLSLRAGWAPIRLGVERNWRFTHFSAKGSCSRGAWCLVKTQDPRTDFGPCLPSRVAWAPSTTTERCSSLPSFQLSSLHVRHSGFFCAEIATACDEVLLYCFCNATGEILGQPRRQCVTRRIRNIGRMKTVVS